MAWSGRHWPSAGRSRHSLHALRHVGYVQELDVKDEIGFGRNYGRPSRFSISQLVGDEEAAFAAYFHACEALIPSRNDAAPALRKLDWLGMWLAHDWLSVRTHDHFAVFIALGRATLVGGVELFAVRGQPAGVVDFVELARLGKGSSAELDILVTEREGDSEHAAGRWNAGR